MSFLNLLSIVIVKNFTNQQDAVKMRTLGLWNCCVMQDVTLRMLNAVINLIVSAMILSMLIWNIGIRIR